MWRHCEGHSDSWLFLSSFFSWLSAKNKIASWSKKLKPNWNLGKAKNTTLGARSPWRRKLEPLKRFRWSVPRRSWRIQMMWSKWRICLPTSTLCLAKNMLLVRLVRRSQAGIFSSCCFFFSVIFFQSFQCTSFFFKSEKIHRQACLRWNFFHSLMQRSSSLQQQLRQWICRSWDRLDRLVCSSWTIQLLWRFSKLGNGLVKPKNVVPCQIYFSSYCRHALFPFSAIHDDEVAKRYRMRHRVARHCNWNRHWGRKLPLCWTCKGSWTKSAWPKCTTGWARSRNCWGRLQKPCVTHRSSSVRCQPWLRVVRSWLIFFNLTSWKSL